MNIKYKRFTIGLVALLIPMLQQVSTQFVGMIPESWNGKILVLVGALTWIGKYLDSQAVK